MKKILSILAIMLMPLVCLAQNIYEWKDGSVTVRRISDIDSITFSISNTQIFISTDSILEVTENSMTASFELHGSLDINNASNITEKGVCFSNTDDIPTIKCNTINCGTYGVGQWEVTLSGLESETTYYFRPYLKIRDEVIYGTVNSFTTKLLSSVRHTVIIYMGAENSLYQISYNDVEELKAALGDIPKDCQVVLYRDAQLKPTIYHLTSDNFTTFKEFPTDMNSADVNVMKGIFRDIVSDFPSEKYSLVLWSHSTGWIDETRSIFLDNEKNSTSNTGTWMSIPDLTSAISSLPHLEFILFDACYMQSIEVASYLYQYASYIIGSPTEIPANGAPYHLILKAMCQTNIQGIIDGYESGYPNPRDGVLLSAISSEEFPNFCDITAKHIPVIFSKDDMPSVEGIQIYAPAYGLARPKQNAMPVPYDMRSAMHKYLDDDAFAEWQLQWQKTVLYSTKAEGWPSMYLPSSYGPFHCTLTDPDYFGGVSMNIPSADYNTRKWNEEFAETPWYRLAGWSQTGW